MRWLWLLPFAAILVYYVVGRYNTAAIRKDWDMVLPPAGQRIQGHLDLQTRLDGTIAEETREWVTRARRRANYTEALRLAELGAHTLIDATPSRLQRLKAMAICARMVSALAPVEPLRPRHFRLSEVMTLAALANLIHTFALTATERFLLKIQVLGLGFRLVVRALGHSTAEMRMAPTTRRAYDIFDAAAADWTTLDREHAEVFKALLISLSAEPKGFVGPRKVT